MGWSRHSQTHSVSFPPKPQATAVCLRQPRPLRSSRDGNRGREGPSCITQFSPSYCRPFCHVILFNLSGWAVCPTAPTERLLQSLLPLLVKLSLFKDNLSLFVPAPTLSYSFNTSSLSLLLPPWPAMASGSCLPFFTCRPRLEGPGEEWKRELSICPCLPPCFQRAQQPPRPLFSLMRLHSQFRFGTTECCCRASGGAGSERGKGAHGTGSKWIIQASKR